MVDKRTVTIPQLSTDEARCLYIYLPASYERDLQRHYPVMYMFDGHNVFFDEDATYGKSWGMKNYMDYSGTQLIIAAVECSHSPDFGRLKEYSPFDFTDPNFGTIIGKGKITMEWFVNTLKPQIDREFRTLKNRENTYIAGSSMGGLMSLYAVIEYNNIFGGAAALSPSLWCVADKVRQMVKNACLDPDTVIYMDYGSSELNNHDDMKKLFADISSLLLEKGAFLTSRIVPCGEHSEESWERQIPFFMNTLLF